MIVGLTGGIASGKSTVSAYFIKRGVPVLDADALAKELTQPGAPGTAAIAKAFGADFLEENGRLNRRKLAEHVFKSPERTAALNALLHPLIQEELLRRAEENTAPIKIIDAPLLLESGLDAVCDKIIVVVCDLETRLRRAQARDGLSREEVLLRISRQASDRQRQARADFVIDNSGLMENTLRQAEAILQKLGG